MFLTPVRQTGHYFHCDRLFCTRGDGKSASLATKRYKEVDSPIQRCRPNLNIVWKEKGLRRKYIHVPPAADLPLPPSTSYFLLYSVFQLIVAKSDYFAYAL